MCQVKTRKLSGFIACVACSEAIGMCVPDVTRANLQFYNTINTSVWLTREQFQLVIRDEVLRSGLILRKSL